MRSAWLGLGAIKASLKRLACVYQSNPWRYWGRLAWHWLPVLLWMGVIFCLSAQPRTALPVAPVRPLDNPLKKLGHVVEYGLLAVLLLRAMRGSWPGRPARRHAVLAFLLSLLYAVSDEFHQFFTPTRNPRPLDLFLDSLGMIWALTLVGFIRQLRRRIAGRRGR